MLYKITIDDSGVDFRSLCAEFQSSLGFWSLNSCVVTMKSSISSPSFPCHYELVFQSKENVQQILL